VIEWLGGILDEQPHRVDGEQRAEPDDVAGLLAHRSVPRVLAVLQATARQGSLRTAWTDLAGEQHVLASSTDGVRGNAFRAASPLPGEERLHQCRALVSQHAGDDYWAMALPPVTQDVPERPDRAGP